MGMHVDFTCPACGLTGHVSGKNDIGMRSCTTTIYCLTCDRLEDVTTGADLDTETPRSFEARCSKNKTHLIRRWNKAEACPRCGKALLKEDRDGNVTMWD